MIMGGRKIIVCWDRLQGHWNTMLENPMILCRDTKVKKREDQRRNF